MTARTGALSPPAAVFTIRRSRRFSARNCLNCCLQTVLARPPVAPVACSMKSLLSRSSHSLSASRSLFALMKLRTAWFASSLSLPPHPATASTASTSAVRRRAIPSVLPKGRARVEFEDGARDLHFVTGLEARRLEGAQHAHGAQALLDVAHRLLVVGVMAGQEPLDPLPLDPEGSRPGALHSVGVAAARPVYAVRGLRLALGLSRRLERDVGEDRIGELVEAGARGG